MGKKYRVIAPDRFLTTQAHKGRVTVRFGNQSVASSLSAVLLNEGDRAPVVYLPKIDMDHAVLEPSGTSYYCRWKGDAVYFNVRCDQEVVTDGAWAYPDAPDDLEVLRNRIAFDAEIFDIQTVDAGRDTAGGQAGGEEPTPHVETQTE